MSANNRERHPRWRAQPSHQLKLSRAWAELADGAVALRVSDQTHSHGSAPRRTTFASPPTANGSFTSKPLPKETGVTSCGRKKEKKPV
ncbi:hypothetical protein [Streptomyces sp. NPDC093093]|uniref:hypothetical protein n=1 Tax=Streptomyces sp. NPDC093093 TaxID=3366025 RepID=UPI00381D9CF1